MFLGEGGGAIKRVPMGNEKDIPMTHQSKDPLHKELPGLQLEPQHRCSLDVFTWTKSTACLALSRGGQTHGSHTVTVRGHMQQNGTPLEHAGMLSQWWWVSQHCCVLMSLNASTKGPEILVRWRRQGCSGAVVPAAAHQLMHQWDACLNAQGEYF